MSSANEESKASEQLTHLSEQVGLQISAYETMAEVYEKYSLALARIMELLRQIYDLGKDHDHGMYQHFGELVTTVAILTEGIKHAEGSARTENEVILQRLNELHIFTEHMAARLTRTESTVLDFRDMMDEFHTEIKQIVNSNLTIVTKVYQQQKLTADFWRKWRMWFYALIGLVAIVESLIQLGVLNLRWFGK